MASRNRFPIYADVTVPGSPMIPVATRPNTRVTPRTVVDQVTLDWERKSHSSVPREFLTNEVGILSLPRSGTPAANVWRPPFVTRSPDRPCPRIGLMVPRPAYYRVETRAFITELSHGFHVLT